MSRPLAVGFSKEEKKKGAVRFERRAATLFADAETVLPVTFTCLLSSRSIKSRATTREDNFGAGNQPTPNMAEQDVKKQQHEADSLRR